MGLLVLLASFWLPTWSGRRAARVEDRAFVVTVELLRAALGHEPVDLRDRAQLQPVLDDLRRRCQELGQPVTDLPDWADDLDSDLPIIGNRHYLYRLARRPEPLRKPPNWDPRARRPLEAYGWPRTLLPPGTSVFFAPETGRVASTRNLGARYNGTVNIPPAGCGRRRSERESNDDSPGYRSVTDERWLLVPAERTWR